MYNPYYQTYPSAYGMNTPGYNNMNQFYQSYSSPYWAVNTSMYYPDFTRGYYDPRFGFTQSMKNNGLVELKDYGPQPFVINIDEATRRNTTFRTALWTGEQLQVTLMSINVGDDIGLEVHPEGDQFIRIEEGQGIVRMGDTKDNLNFQAAIADDFAIMIPAGKWHNIINTGNIPLKLYAIYAPPEHPRGTVHVTKADAEAAEQG